MGKQSSGGIPVVGPILNRIIGTRNDRFVKRYTTRVAQINAMEAEARRLSDAELRGKLGELRAKFDAGAKEDDLLVPAFAYAREAMDRSVGIRNAIRPEWKELGFAQDRLSPEMRALHEELVAQGAALEPIEPDGEWLGWDAPIPGWRRVEIPVAFYDAVREIYTESRPPFRARPFDVQLIGGMVLSGGKIAEMKTGEGKTIVAPLATYLGCVRRMKVHVVTVNDYLVQRDRDWTAPFFHALGLTVGAIHPQHMQGEDVKRRMYRCDVVYGTTSEFGFDYLRDNMKRSAEQQVQKRRDFAIVDEVDSVLIDEARTPLIISGLAHEDEPRYDLADRLARHLVDKQRPWAELDEKVTACENRIKGIEGDIRQSRDKARVPELQAQLAEAKKELPRLQAERDQHVQYFEVKLERKSAQLTHDGVAEAQRVAGLGSLYVGENMDLPHLLENSIRAHAVYRRDRDYVVMDLPDQMTGRVQPSVVIVDTNTGRPMVGRQWSDGLHQAVESKEKVPIKQETQTVATVTIQNFFKMYKRLAGMTGTADTEAQEFHDIYKLDVVSIPTNKEVVRTDREDLMFLSEKDKWTSIVDEIKRFNDVGRPILVGTTSVEKSEMLSKMLTQRHGAKHEVLNAKQHEREAHIVEDAGQLGAVMIATNMAGRGTDIKLGRVTRASLLEHWLKRGICSRTLTVDASEEELRENVYRKVAANELEINKREAEEIPWAELELRLLRKWALEFTWLGDKKIETMGVDELRTALDEGGRCALHRVRWYESVEDMGGLHVIGTERHESRRIDNQLRGRSGRQGDNGSSRFFVSFDDDLMRLFSGDTQKKVLARLGMKEGDAIEHPWVSKSVERAQRKVEERNFQIRKNILEYDEVMEHQRQYFYGLRQRVLEGRDVKGLIFDYIEEATRDACAKYLDPDYAATCAAEFAKQKIECSIMPERLRKKDREDMEETIRRDAKSEMRSMIDVTLGEFIAAEGSEVLVDFDAKGLVSWAKNRFGVELDEAQIAQGSTADRRFVEDMLVEAAEKRVEETDLSGLVEFTGADYGAEQLAKWAKGKFGIDVPIEEIRTQQQEDEGDPAKPILERVRELYHQREVRYPVEYAMEMTKAIAQREGAMAALGQLSAWSTRRYGPGFSEDELKSTPPAKVMEKLLEASERFVAEDKLRHGIEEALLYTTDDELDAFLRERYGVPLGDHMRWLEGEERVNAIRARVESILRSELLQFERAVLIDTLDTSWKDHLYAMDQLRDSISFRAFSQQDPRIAFKKEGSQLFQEMLDGVRDRVTDYIFRARINPAMMMPPPPPVRRPAGPTSPVGGPGGGPGGGEGQPAGAPRGVVNLGGSSISGPGLA
ncbi:MAG: preprotein translocase subunit SecA [Phycisphaerales bacterium]|jgi:preprotein translocase subunit SecA|nr:preprotein translocase subunit SecA [Phycisphaerales bacterium]